MADGKKRCSACGIELPVLAGPPVYSTCEGVSNRLEAGRVRSPMADLWRRNAGHCGERAAQRPPGGPPNPGADADDTMRQLYGLRPNG